MSKWGKIFILITTNYLANTYQLQSSYMLILIPITSLFKINT